jgi:hypothetical protein
MRRLRQKVELEPNRPAHLITVRGVGYRLLAGDGRIAAPDGAEPVPEGAEG